MDKTKIKRIAKSSINSQYKKWSRPKLIILVRGMPQELVLTGCKGADLGAPTEYNKSCYEIYAGITCNGCSETETS